MRASFLKHHGGDESHAISCPYGDNISKGFLISTFLPYILLSDKEYGRYLGYNTNKEKTKSLLLEFNL